MQAFTLATGYRVHEIRTAFPSTVVRDVAFLGIAGRLRRKRINLQFVFLRERLSLSHSL